MRPPGRIREIEKEEGTGREKGHRLEEKSIESEEGESCERPSRYEGGQGLDEEKESSKEKDGGSENAQEEEYAEIAHNGKNSGATDHGTQEDRTDTLQRKEDREKREEGKGPEEPYRKMGLPTDRKPRSREDEEEGTEGERAALGIGHRIRKEKNREDQEREDRPEHRRTSGLHLPDEIRLTSDRRAEEEKTDTAEGDRNRHRVSTPRTERRRMKGTGLGELPNPPRPPNAPAEGMLPHTAGPLPAPLRGDRHTSERDQRQDRDRTLKIK